MRRAIEFAHENPQAPFGSVLVDRRVGEIVASGINKSSAKLDSIRSDVMSHRGRRAAEDDLTLGVIKALD